MCIWKRRKRVLDSWRLGTGTDRMCIFAYLHIYMQKNRSVLHTQMHMHIHTISVPSKFLCVCAYLEASINNIGLAP